LLSAGRPPARFGAGWPKCLARSEVTTPAIRRKTPARYHGLEVTIVGETAAGLQAVTGYGTPQERAIAMIAIKRRRGRRVYSVAGTHEWTASVATVAYAAVKAREARDARLRLIRRGGLRPR